MPIKRPHPSNPEKSTIAGFFVLVMFGCRPFAEFRYESPEPTCASAATDHLDVVRIEGGVLAGHRLRSFFLDRTEVTVAAYSACVEAGVCQEQGAGRDCTHGRGNYPVNCISYSDAVSFCGWRGARLPTAWEWLWAAQGGAERRKYPWGSEPATCDRAVLPINPDLSNFERMAGCGAHGPMPVGSKPLGASADGVEDLVGNLAEYTATVASHGNVVKLGGGWSYGAPRRLSEYELVGGDFRWNGRGFRCAVDELQPCQGPAR